MAKQDDSTGELLLIAGLIYLLSLYKPQSTVTLYQECSDGSRVPLGQQCPGDGTVQSVQCVDCISGTVYSLQGPGPCPNCQTTTVTCSNCNGGVYVLNGQGPCPPCPVVCSDCAGGAYGLPVGPCPPCGPVTWCQDCFGDVYPLPGVGACPPCTDPMGA